MRLDKIIIIISRLFFFNISSDPETNTTKRQLRRIVKMTEDRLQSKKYNEAIFNGTTLALNKIWHDDVLHKINTVLFVKCHC